jgi:cell division initiation protein
VRARQIIADMEDRLKALIEQYKKMESTRDDMVSELRRLASEVLDKVERSKQQSKGFDPDKHLSVVKTEAKKIAFPNLDYEKSPRKEQTEEKHEEIVEEHHLPRETPKKPQKSFFDEIG